MLDFAEILDDNPFAEMPVDVYTFVEDQEYLNLPPLSRIQYDIVEAMSQIYREEDLSRYMTASEAANRYRKYTKKEVILSLGKGSGKDHVATIGMAYVVHKLLCLKDPARYYGKPPGDAIDLINIAINAKQAKNVFFKGFKSKINRARWFDGKFKSRTDDVEFDKAVTVYSGHSERESHEGLNLFMAVLDEISGFGEGTALTQQGKTGENIYKAFRGTVDSRFPDLGKVILLSFPRYADDYITQKYEGAIAGKETVSRNHRFIINNDLPADLEGNSFEIDWKEDHITEYTMDGVYALKRPTWEVNPTREVEDFKMAFFSDPADARQRFLCQPTISNEAFFRNREKIENSMSIINPIEKSKRIFESWKPDPKVTYFLHADLAQLHDKCSVAVAHVDKWVSIEVTDKFKQIAPLIVVDMIVFWEPHVEGPVDLSQVKNWILSFKRMGADIGRVTFDRWGAIDIKAELLAYGIKTETLSVGKAHYEDLAMLLYEDRLVLPHIPLLVQEMTELVIVNDKKVDHPRKGSKDISDSMTGAVFNAISLSKRNVNNEIEVHTMARSSGTEDVKDEPPEMTADAHEFLLNVGII